jgi:hypothetical protein
MLNPSRKTNLTKENEHHLEGEFNGVNWQINKDGELTVTFKSPSDLEGKYLDEEAGGTNFKISKDGSFSFEDGKTNKIVSNKTEETLQIESGKDMSIKTGANFNLEGTENTSSTVKDLIAKASGKASVNSESGLELKSSGSVSLQGSEVNIKSDSIVKVEGSMLDVGASQIMLGKGGQPAVIMTTIFQGPGNLGAPVIATAIGPYSSSVSIAP